MSAQRCFTAWNDPIGLPNCTRSLAWATLISSTRAAAPSDSADVAAAPRSSRAAASSGPPISSPAAVGVDPADAAGQVHRRLGAPAGPTARSCTTTPVGDATTATSATGA